MLPEKYDPELTTAQNYFGDDFDGETFVDQYADAYAESYFDPNDPDKWDVAFRQATKVAERSLEWVISELQNKAGENLGRIDEELKCLEREGERSLRPGAIKRFLEKSAGGEQNVTDLDIEVTCIAVKHGLGVVQALMFHREIEMSFAGMGSESPGTDSSHN